MDEQTFLTLVIDDGIEAARLSYKNDTLKRNGAIAGFEACRSLNTDQLADLLKSAEKASEKAMREGAPDYWYWRCRTLEIEWVCNVVSAVRMNSGLSIIINPTVRGMMKAAEIIGV